MYWELTTAHISLSFSNYFPIFFECCWNKTYTRTVSKSVLLDAGQTSLRAQKCIIFENIQLKALQYSCCKAKEKFHSRKWKASNVFEWLGLYCYLENITSKLK